MGRRLYVCSGERPHMPRSAVSVGVGGRVSAKAMRGPIPAAAVQRRTRQSLVSTTPAQRFIRPNVQRSPQYTVRAAQAHSALTWFSPPVEAVARGVAAEQSPATWSHSNELTQRLASLPVAAAAAAANENASVDNPWYQQRETVQSTDRDWFDDNYAANSNLLTEKNRLHKAYVTRPTGDHNVTFFRSRRLVQQQLREVQDGSQGREDSRGFAVANGVKQGCVLASSLFSLMFSAVLMDACSDSRPGIRIACRTDGLLLNHRRMYFHLCVSTTATYELFFADDCALNTTSEGGMQRSMDVFSSACDNFGLVINTKNTVVMHQPSPNAADVAIQLNVNGAQLRVVEDFTYLGSTSPSPPRSIVKLPTGSSKPAKPSAVRNTPSGTVALSSKNTEAEVAEPNSGHGCVEADENPQHLLHTETITTTLERPSRADGRRAVTQTTLLRDIATGSRRQEANSAAIWTLKTSLKRLQINPPGWEYLTRDRPTWRRTVNTGAAIYEANRITTVKAKGEACRS
nr:unnamed protein product [Spirometra erinaceieuropaei]